MTEEHLKQDMLSAVDVELRDCVDYFFQNKPDEFADIIFYQMGWERNNPIGGATGKRLRPLFTLATCHALGGDWRTALPAAAAVELVHNFSLVHDDIQDHSVTRRGKPTVWVNWGEAQAINMGDALLATAFLALHRLNLAGAITLQALGNLTKATLTLTTGQYLDLVFEKAENIPLNAYWEMVSGKTGALFGTCFALSAIVAGLSDVEISKFEAFGYRLGIAFQLQDDYLGVFSNDAQIGKSTSGDLQERKKTYPILYGLTHLPDFRRLWAEHDRFSETEIDLLKEILEKNGVREITHSKARELYEILEKDFLNLFNQKEESRLLGNLIEGLFDRSM